MGLLGASGKFIGRRLEAKARKHDQSWVLAVSKLNTIADRILTALTDDKISEEEFCLTVSEFEKYDQMKAEIRRGHQKQGGLPKREKKQLVHLMRDEAMMAAHTKLLEELNIAGTVAPLDKHLGSLGLSFLKPLQHFGSWPPRKSHLEPHIPYLRPVDRVEVRQVRAIDYGPTGRILYCAQPVSLSPITPG